MSFGEKSVLEPIFLICIDPDHPGGITALPNGDFWNFQIILCSHLSFLASGDHQNPDFHYQISKNHFLRDGWFVIVMMVRIDFTNLSVTHGLKFLGLEPRKI